MLQDALLFLVVTIVAGILDLSGVATQIAWCFLRSASSSC